MHAGCIKIIVTSLILEVSEEGIDKGEVAEWLKVLLSKSSELARVPWVRIPPSPPVII